MTAGTHGSTFGGNPLAMAAGNAVLDIILSTMRGKLPHHEPQVKSDVRAVVIGVILYLIFLFGFHPYILKLPIVA